MHMLDLFAHFQLVNISSESYFMPCLLLPDPTVASPLIGLDVINISPPPLVVLFEKGFVPIFWHN